MNAQAITLEKASQESDQRVSKSMMVTSKASVNKYISKLVKKTIQEKKQKREQLNPPVYFQ